MCLLKIKTQEKRNEVNNTSSSGSAASATMMTAIKHASGTGMPGAGVSTVSLETQSRQGGYSPKGDTYQELPVCQAEY